MSLTINEVISKFIEAGSEMLANGEDPNIVVSGIVHAAAAMSVANDHATGQSHQITINFFANSLQGICQNSRNITSDKKRNIISMSKKSEEITIVHLGGPTKRAASSDDYVDMEAKYASLVETNENLCKEIARLRERPTPPSDLIRSFQDNFRIIEEEVEKAKEINRQNRNPYNASTTKQIEASRAMAKDAVLIAKIVCKVE